MTEHKVVSQKEWLDARLALMAKEKALTHQLDAIRRERLELPWVRVDKAYTFDTPEGKVTLADLFGDKSQLIVYHFMLGPDWEQGCPSCSMAADTIHANYPHLTSRDIAFTMVSRAPMEQITIFKKRMGWSVPWVSSFHSDFNYDYGVTKAAGAPERGWYNFGQNGHPSDEAPGVSAFYKDAEGIVYRTYSSYARGVESLLGVYPLLDVAPKGREEDGLPWPMAWVKHHDRYEAAKPVEACCAH